jgi:hypothetical protein
LNGNVVEACHFFLIQKLPVMEKWEKLGRRVYLRLTQPNRITVWVVKRGVKFTTVKIRIRPTNYLQINSVETLLQMGMSVVKSLISVILGSEWYSILCRSGKFQI